MEHLMRVVEANPQFFDPPSRRSYTKPPDLVDHPFIPFEQLPTNCPSASPPAPLSPHPIAPAPDTSRKPAPVRVENLPGDAASLAKRKQKLTEAKLTRAYREGGLSCGCDPRPLAEWVVLQLGLRGLPATPEQLQSLLDIRCVKDEWKPFFVKDSGGVLTGMQRVRVLTLEQIVAFIEAHQLVCCNHWQSNNPHYASPHKHSTRDRKQHRYRRVLRRDGGCQAHTLPSFRGLHCPFSNSTRPLLNLHHKTATCTEETWKLIEDPTCSEEEFHWYLHSGNLVCLCEVCHRIVHADKLIRNCKPCALGCCSPSPEPIAAASSCSSSAPSTSPEPKPPDAMRE